MQSGIVVLGAGFGGLELATVLSEALGDDADVTLIDGNDAFVFGYSKLDVMFGRAAPEEVRLPYADIVKPGVRFLRETITAIDPEARRVTTNRGSHEADVLVVRRRLGRTSPTTCARCSGSPSARTRPRPPATGSPRSKSCSGSGRRARPAISSGRHSRS